MRRALVDRIITRDMRKVTVAMSFIHRGVMTRQGHR